MGSQVGPVPPEVAERLRRRYPGPRVPKPVLVALVAVGTLVAVGWLVWAALVGSTPAVSAQVSAYRVLSDSAMSVTVTVDRRDPAVPASCRVVAQATDFQPVAEYQLEMGPSPDRLASRTVRLTTLRRATSARVTGCASG